MQPTCMGMCDVAQQTAATHLAAAQRWRDDQKTTRPNRTKEHSALWRLTAVFALFLSTMAAHSLVMTALGGLQ